MPKSLLDNFNISDDQLLDIVKKCEDENLFNDDLYTYPLQSSLSHAQKDYEEFEEVNRGGEKKIIRAMDYKANRFVAIAQPHDRSKEGIERFVREARITACLEHPNIIPVYTMGVDEKNIPYYAMEMLRGKTLSTLISDFHDDEESKIQLEDLLEVLLKVCDAISYAHSSQVIHLDIKPDNIQVGVHGEVLLIDWGLAKVLSDETGEEKINTQRPLDSNLLNDMTMTGTLKGSPGYMAPEQSGGIGEKGIGTDIYALGAVLYTILTNLKHVEGDNVKDILLNIATGNVKSPIERMKTANIDESLSAVCMKALNLEIEDRYKTSANSVLKFAPFYVVMRQMPNMLAP